MYTDNKSAQIVLSILKQYNINFVISPEATNIPIFCIENRTIFLFLLLFK